MKDTKRLEAILKDLEKENVLKSDHCDCIKKWRKLPKSIKEEWRRQSEGGTRTAFNLFVSYCKKKERI